MIDTPDAVNTAVAARTTGILPSQVLREMIARGDITAPAAIAEAQIQPASIDLRLGSKAFRVPASFLPGRDKAISARGASGMTDLGAQKRGAGAPYQVACVCATICICRAALLHGSDGYRLHMRCRRVELY